jgi:pyruvate kinase
MNNPARRTKIICTLGPSTRTPNQLRSMLLNGMDVARFNFSHGGPSLQAEHIANLRAVSSELQIPVAILQDLQGPKIRTGSVAGGEVELVEGQRFILTTRPVAGNETEVSTTYAALPRDCRKGDQILLDDGYIQLEVEEVSDTDVVCLITDGGTLKANKGINLPGVHVSAPAMSEKDRHDVAWGFGNGIDFVALSFVRQAAEVIELKRMALEAGAHTQIIAKLEKPEALENLDAIIEAADGVMVARGDLGVEMAPEEVPLLQKRIIKAANDAGKFVITATQMLESMTHAQRPTRAEVSDVANAVLDGTDAVMLSGETAAGDYPVETLQMMARIVKEVEEGTDSNWRKGRVLGRSSSPDFTDAVCESAAHAAASLGAQAIVCFSESGGTARRLARFRPPVPILAMTPHENVVRQLKIVWGIESELVARSKETDEMIILADGYLEQRGRVAKGDIVVFTLGAPVALRGSTNLLKLHRIGETHTV